MKTDKTPGWHDLTIFLPGGRAHYVEVKRKGGYLRPLQRHMHSKLAALGFTVEVVTGEEEARAWVEQNCGTPDRTRKQG